MNEQTVAYNGWSNRETWLASLWLNNDEPMYGLLMDSYCERQEIHEQASWLEDMLRNTLDEAYVGAGFWSDLISTAFNQVNWLEVIENNRD